MPEHLECGVLQKQCYINPLTFTFFMYKLHTGQQYNARSFDFDGKI